MDAPDGGTVPTGGSRRALPDVLPLVIDALIETVGEDDNTLLGITEQTWLGADLDLVSLQLVYLSAALQDRFPDLLDPAHLFDPAAAPSDVTVRDLAQRILAVLGEESPPGPCDDRGRAMTGDVAPGGVVR